MKLVDIKMELAKRIGKEDKNGPNAKKSSGKTSFILCRLSVFIGLPVMMSLSDNAMHHPLWRAWKEGRGYGDRVEAIKMERMKRLMRRQVGVKETGTGPEEARLSINASEPMSTRGPSQQEMFLDFQMGNVKIQTDTASAARNPCDSCRLGSGLDVLSSSKQFSL